MKKHLSEQELREIVKKSLLKKEARNVDRMNLLRSPGSDYFSRTFGLAADRAKTALGLLGLGAFLFPYADDAITWAMKGSTGGSKGKGQPRGQKVGVNMTAISKNEHISKIYTRFMTAFPNCPNLAIGVLANIEAESANSWSPRSSGDPIGTGSLTQSKCGKWCINVDDPRWGKTFRHRNRGVCCSFGYCQLQICSGKGRSYLNWCEEGLHKIPVTEENIEATKRKIKFLTDGDKQIDWMIEWTKENVGTYTLEGGNVNAGTVLHRAGPINFDPDDCEASVSEWCTWWYQVFEIAGGRKKPHKKRSRINRATKFLKSGSVFNLGAAESNIDIDKEKQEQPTQKEKKVDINKGDALQALRNLGLETNYGVFGDSQIAGELGENLKKKADELLGDLSVNEWVMRGKSSASPGKFKEQIGNWVNVSMQVVNGDRNLILCFANPKGYKSVFNNIKIRLADAVKSGAKLDADHQLSIYIIGTIPAFWPDNECSCWIGQKDYKMWVSNSSEYPTTEKFIKKYDSRYSRSTGDIAVAAGVGSAILGDYEGVNVFYVNPHNWDAFPTKEELIQFHPDDEGFDKDMHMTDDGIHLEGEWAEGFAEWFWTTDHS